jgi:hypothetical protein
MAKPIHSAQRQVQALTLGVAKSQRKVRERERELGFAETEQQYQFPISGYVGPTAAFITTEILFDFPFYYAPGQRDSDLEKPQMRQGFESPDNVMITIGVREWNVNEDTGGVIGATLVIGVLAAVAVTFTATGHAEFQGFSAPDDHLDDEVA